MGEPSFPQIYIGRWRRFAAFGLTILLLLLTFSPVATCPVGGLGYGLLALGDNGFGYPTPNQPLALPAIGTTGAALPAVATAAAVGAYVALLGAQRPVTAIFSFLAYLMALLLSFFGLGADYVGAIHLLVYPGAILIFFAFATLTTDQRGHWRQWTLAEGGGSGGSGVALASALTLGGMG